MGLNAGRRWDQFVPSQIQVSLPYEPFSRLPPLNNTTYPRPASNAIDAPYREVGSFAGLSEIHFGAFG